MICVRARTVIRTSILAAFAVLSGASAVRAQYYGGPPGEGGNWQITYNHAGSKLLFHHYRIEGQQGSQTATAVTTDLLAQGQQPLDNSIGFSAGGQSYYPTPDMKPVGLSTSCEVELKTKATVTWVGQGPAPAAVKLKLTGSASAAYRYAVGSISASNGLGHDQVANQGTSWYGGPPPNGSYIPWGNADSSGSRYREFPVSGGTVQLTIVTKASASGKGNWSAGASNGVSITNWAVDVKSDRDMTYRRVDSGGVVSRVANNMEDDGVTPRLPANKIGDAKATEPNIWNGNERDFASTFTLSCAGPWSWETTVSLLSSATLESHGNFNLVAGYNNIPASSSKPIKTITVTGSANDPTNGISDTCTYVMRVHLEAEKEKLIATFNNDYLYWSKDVPEFATYNYQKHEPWIMWSKGNSTSSPMPINLTEQNELSVTAGWEYTQTAGAELTVELAKILFNNTWKVNGSITIKESTTTAANISIAAGHRLEVWNCPFGSLQKHLTSRWGDQGYKHDAYDFELSSYSQDVKYWERPNAAPRVIPHSYN
jgi:hypothetical protein